MYGPNNTLNLLANEIDVVLSNGAKAAPPSTAPSLPDRQRCIDELAQAPGDFPGIYQGPTAGTTFCLQTAAGHYAAARVTDTSAHYAITLVVWP
ncbi:hypothetical protein [Kitasatospora sp. NPDC002522]